MRLSKSYAKEEKFRYLRIVVNALRGNTTVFQVSEIKILSKTGESMPWPTETLVTSTMAETSEAESPKKLIDGSVETKFCSTHFSPGAQINIDLKSNVLDRKEYTSWQWFTANDSPERDPVSFELLGSVDGIEFITLDSALNATITETRNTLAYSGSIGTLPEEYTQVEYIQSAGTQYIDTGFNPKSTSRVVMEFEFLKNATASPFMSRDTSNDTNMFGVFNINGRLRSDFNTTKVSFPAGLSPLQKLLYDRNKNVCTIGSETITNANGTFSAPRPLFLFASNDSGNARFFTTGKLYSCRIFDNESLILDFVPCKNAAGTVGLYDLIGQKFYDNSGSGNFTAGPKVTQPSNDAIYVKVNGIWKQIDGIKLL